MKQNKAFQNNSNLYSKCKKPKGQLISVPSVPQTPKWETLQGEEGRGGEGRGERRGGGEEGVYDPFPTCRIYRLS